MSNYYRYYDKYDLHTCVTLSRIWVSFSTSEETDVADDFFFGTVLFLILLGAGVSGSKLDVPSPGFRSPLTAVAAGACSGAGTVN